MSAPALAVRAPTSARGSAVAGAFRAERRKLLAQLPTRVLLLVCALGPLAFAVVLREQSGVPADTLLGAWVHTSGYAVSLVVLGFGGYLGFPILAGVLAGDVMSGEDRHGTWKTLLTRSSGRDALFAGKVLVVLALAAALVLLTGASSLLAGLLVTGAHPLVGFSGVQLGSGEALAQTLLAWLLAVPPVLAFTCLAVLLSTATRNGIVGVVGPVLIALAMQLLALVGSGSWVHTALLASAFDNWHGLFASPRFYAPTAIDLAVCAVWSAACLWGARALLRRRDFTGPPVARRAGWVLPVRTVLAAAAILVALAAASSLGPTAITRLRLEAAIGPAFNELTLLQQRELGRSVPADAALHLRTSCYRRSGAAGGPGDDWSCTLTVVSAPVGSSPLQLTNVAYDVSVRSNGCYKADAPPSFVGAQMMRTARGASVVNPLFSIYGCFDTTGHAPQCPANVHCTAPEAAGVGAGSTPRGSSAPHVPATPAQGEAERKAGSARIREIEESERSILKEERVPEGGRPSG